MTQRPVLFLCFAVIAGLAVTALPIVALAQEGAQTEAAEEAKPKPKNSDDLSKVDSQFKNLKSLSKKGEVWFSPKDKVVVVGGHICLNRGQLEMFACVPQTKEHESIIVINGRALEVHTALLAIGAKSGKPSVFAPKYVPATGDTIEIEVHWVDGKGNPQKVRAQDWIRNTRTGKAMTHDFIFGGSGFFDDEISGEKFYMAEGGEVICVSNFGTAMLDIPVESSQLNDGLMFEAFHDRIPAIKTKVRLVFKKKKKVADKEKPAEEKKEKPKQTESREATAEK